MDEEAPRLERWLNEKTWRKWHTWQIIFDKRLDPRLLVDGAKTIISLLLNYYTNEKQNKDAPKLSKYCLWRGLSFCY